MANQNSNLTVLTITRTFDAVPERIWDAWTDPAIIKKWWGPRDFTSPVSKIDFRIGGKYFICMRSPQGKDYCSTGVYHAAIAPSKLIMSDSFADKNGKVVPASYYGLSKDFPMEMTIILTLEKQEGKTKLTLQYEGIPESEVNNTRQGWSQSFDKLSKILKGF